MCLIIHKTLVDDLTLDFLTDVWQKNNDGWGILYNDPATGEVTALKGLVFSDYLMEHYRLEEEGVEFITHFRYATHGKVNRKNCHPFKVMDGMYLMHNGMFDVEMGTEKKLSDTRVFIRDVLRPMLDAVENPFEFIQTYAFQNMVDFYCEGQDSRLVIYTNDGPLFFGTWRETTKGTLVSNNYAYRVDNPTYRATLSSGITKTNYDDFNWANYASSGSSTTIERKPDDEGFYPEMGDLDERFRDLVEEDTRYVKSLNDAMDNFEGIAEVYWDLTDLEIEFVMQKLCDGEWCFEIDDYNPHESILWDEQGQIIRKDNLSTYIHLSTAQYA